MLNIRIEKTTSPRVRPDYSKLGFGKHFTDHMFLMNYSPEKRLARCEIVPYSSLLTRLQWFSITHRNFLKDLKPIVVKTAAFSFSVPTKISSV